MIKRNQVKISNLFIIECKYIHLYFLLLLTCALLMQTSTSNHGIFITTIDYNITRQYYGVLKQFLHPVPKHDKRKKSFYTRTSIMISSKLITCCDIIYWPLFLKNQLSMLITIKLIIAKLCLYMYNVARNFLAWGLS